MTGVEVGDESGLVDNGAAGGVDQDETRLREGEFVVGDDVAGFKLNVSVQAASDMLAGKSLRSEAD